MESVEIYTSYHSETFEEILEWPYRRYEKAFDAWQRRHALDEIENKKLSHINALLGIVEWKEAEDQKNAIESVEKYYELLKDIVWNPNKMQEENEEMQQLESEDPFLAAGKRNLQKVVNFPNQELIEDIISD